MRALTDAEQTVYLAALDDNTLVIDSCLHPSARTRDFDASSATIVQRCYGCMTGQVPTSTAADRHLAVWPTMACFAAADRASEALRDIFRLRDEDATAVRARYLDDLLALGDATDDRDMVVAIGEALVVIEDPQWWCNREKFLTNSAREPLDTLIARVFNDAAGWCNHLLEKAGNAESGAEQ